MSVEILPIATQQGETTCTTSPEQTEVTKLEGYSGTMCNKHVHSTVTRSTPFHCPIGVINKPTTGELFIPPVYRRLAVAKSTMYRVGQKRTIFTLDNFVTVSPRKACSMSKFSKFYGEKRYKILISVSLNILCQICSNRHNS